VYTQFLKRRFPGECKRVSSEEDTMCHEWEFARGKNNCLWSLFLDNKTVFPSLTVLKRFGIKLCSMWIGTQLWKCQRTDLHILLAHTHTHHTHTHTHTHTHDMPIVASEKMGERHAHTLSLSRSISLSLSHTHTHSHGLACLPGTCAPCQLLRERGWEPPKNGEIALWPTMRVVTWE